MINIMRSINEQRGAATVLISLVIMTAISLLTLTVAHTRVTEQRMEAAQSWHSRLFANAESEWHDTAANLIKHLPQMKWIASSRTLKQTHQGHQQQRDGSIMTTSLLTRSGRESRIIRIESMAKRTDGSGHGVHVTQSVRLLSVISPLAEDAPPLILNGCLSGGSSGSNLRPLDKGPGKISEAAWNFHSGPCPAGFIMHTHGGSILQKHANQSLWDTLFSVSRTDFAQLAAADARLPANQRRYWQINPSDLSAGRWRQSLGSSTKPVVAHFTRKSGCPRFSDGVRIFGFVFIDAPCLAPISTASMEIYGTLVVNGALNAGNARLQLNHIRYADRHLTRLDLPFLRLVAVPGTWRDF